MCAPPKNWDTQHYETFKFIPKYGEALLDLAQLQPFEHALDLGCGTGHLTSLMAKQCQHVIGIDYSENMIKTAKETYPDLDFRTGDATSFSLEKPVDVIISNATLHWVLDPTAAILCIKKALTPNGRFIAEFGGKHNVETILAGVRYALDQLGTTPLWQDYWYFPSLATYTSLLEAQGFHVELAQHFKRPTPMDSGETGLRDWLTMFVLPHTSAVPPEKIQAFYNHVETHCRPTLFQDGRWVLDYVRLRIIAKI